MKMSSPSPSGLKTASRWSLCVLALLPLLAVGCKDKTSTTSTTSGTIKVGIMHSLTRTMATSEISLRDAEQMAIDEINAAGGVLGKKIEAIVEDPKSDFDTGF